MKIYLSGPMSGLPEFNHPAFNAAAKALRALGMDVVNPAENVIDTEGLAEHEVWRAHMKVDIQQLLDCKAVVLLPGWANSKGATLERTIAQALGLKLVNFTEAVLSGLLVRGIDPHKLNASNLGGGKAKHTLAQTTQPQCELAEDGVCETLDCSNHRFAQGLTTNNAAVDREKHAYESGWNSALEMAAFKITHDFKQAFGSDTLSSLAVFIRGMKK